MDAIDNARQRVNASIRSPVCFPHIWCVHCFPLSLLNTGLHSLGYFFYVFTVVVPSQQHIFISFFRQLSFGKFDLCFLFFLFVSLIFFLPRCVYPNERRYVLSFVYAYKFAC